MVTFSLLWEWKNVWLTVIQCKSLSSWRCHMLVRCIYLAARRVSQVHSCCAQERCFPFHPCLRSTLPEKKCRSTPYPIPRRFLHSFFSSVILNWMRVKCETWLASQTSKVASVIRCCVIEKKIETCSNLPQMQWCFLLSHFWGLFHKTKYYLDQQNTQFK